MDRIETQRRREYDPVMASQSNWALAAAWLVALAMAAACSSCSTGPGSTQAQVAGQPVTISIVGTNDLHGGILPSDGRGGLALLAGYVKNLRDARSRDGGGVLLIDAGDMWQGTLESNLTEGASVVSAYNALGYAAAAIGNHEFDFGPVGPAATPQRPTDDPRGALKARAAEAKFPVLAANLVDASTGRPVDWPNVTPSILVGAAGVHVGIVGVMTKNALTSTIAANTGGLTIAPLLATITAEAARLRSQGADAVIVTAHAGGSCTRFDQPVDLSSCESDSEIAELARALPPNLVDVIVAGHTHEGMAHEIAGIAIIESFSGGRAFGRVDLSVVPGAKRVSGRRIFSPQDLCESINEKTQACIPSSAAGETRVAARYEGTAVRPDGAIAALLTPAVERARDLESSSLGVLLETGIRRGDETESALGNLFTDAWRESTPGADVAINNTRGGLRADLPRGPLTYGSLFRVFPFDNRLVSLKLTGRQLRQLFTAQLQASADPLGISGVRIQARCTAGTVVTTLLRPSGQPIRDDEPVVVVTTDFLATGAVFERVMAKGGLVVPANAPLGRDIVAGWLRRRGGTLRESQFVERDSPRWTLPGTLPLRCKAGV